VKELGRVFSSNDEAETGGLLIETENSTATIRARIAPIPSAYLARVRAKGLDDLGQPVKRMRASGGEPCRDVLRRAREGEELILASFSPFEKHGPYKEYGPIFLLANESDVEADRQALQAGSENDYLRSQFAIRAYSEDEEILDAALVQAVDAQRVVNELFARPETAFLHVRFPAYGCFACRLDRP
jgi:hypothetical protein